MAPKQSYVNAAMLNKQATLHAVFDMSTAIILYNTFKTTTPVHHSLKVLSLKRCDRFFRIPPSVSASLPNLFLPSLPFPLKSS